MRAPARFLTVLTMSWLVPAAAMATVERHKFRKADGTAYLTVELLGDRLVHFEAGPGQGPDEGRPIAASPMVAKTDYGGPSQAAVSGTTLQTAAVELKVDPTNLCVTASDRARGGALFTTFCPIAPGASDGSEGLDIDPAATRQVYGLGEQFVGYGSSDGDWLTLKHRDSGSPFGNQAQGYHGSLIGNVQIPVYYALGDGGLDYAAFVDNVYKQTWDFGVSWWRARMFGDQIRWYLMTGADPLALRSAYTELTGRPPVPPRKAFGLWVSEFGYRSFDRIDTLEQGLRAGGFPVDGFVLDLNWFGGVQGKNNPRTHMGRLDWDEDQHQDDLDHNPYSFPNPGPKIQSYARDNLGLCAIEESYLAQGTDTHDKMPASLSTYQRTNGACDPAHQDSSVDDVSGFWGNGRMIDWSDPAAGRWIHDNRRYPHLAGLGITCHWTDLGEPESFDPRACYQGVETVPAPGGGAAAVKNEHQDIHNLYNLLWNRSIWDGYAARSGQANALGVTNPRPFILTRSGAAGTQRFGAAMWSGDIPATLEALASHANAQMHMSFSGIDYFGADVGGFRRELMPGNDDNGRYLGYQDEIYTQWLANASWFDVPVRPHVDKEFKPFSGYETAPNLVGKADSNLANLRQRYELIPYYYSLAHLAHETGAPVVPPPVFYYQDDPNLRGVGHEKLIGRDLLVGVVAGYGEYARNVYLPAGRWAEYHTNEWVHSSGQAVADVPVYRDGSFRLPAFARAGAILPKMVVDQATEDAFGHRKPGATPRTDLVVRVYADAAESSFTLYEDDGLTLRYDAAGRPSYDHRTTRIGQRLADPATATVTIDPAVDSAGGPYPGAVASRPNFVELVVDEAKASGVALNSQPLPEQADRAAFDAAPSGWLNAGHNLVLAKSAALPVGDAKRFTFTLQPDPGKASVYFACDNGYTRPGQSVFVAGSLPELGAWDPKKALKLEPNVYYQYIVDGRQGRPVWTRVLAGLPRDTGFEWKCLRLNDDGSGAPDWQPGPNMTFRTGTAPGYAGRALGGL